MAVKLYKVYKELSKYSPALYSKSGGEEILVDVELFSPDENVFHEKILYIGKASQFINIHRDKLNKGVYLIEVDKEYDNNWFINNNISFIEVSNVQDIQDLFVKVKNLFIENYMVLQNSADFLNALTSDRGLNYIINISSEVLQNPIILIDSCFKVLAHSDIKYITEPFWIRNINLGYCSYEFISEVNKIKSFRNAPNSTEPFIVICKESPIRKLVSKVIIDGNIVGYIILLESIEKFTESSYETIKILSNVISEELKKDQVYRNLGGLRYENLLIDILERSIIDEYALKERMKSIDCSFGDNLCLLVLDISQYNSNVTKPNFLKGSLEQLFPKHKSLFYKEHVLIVLDLLYEEKVEYFMDKDITSFLEENNIILIVSNNFSDILDLSKHYQQALDSMEIIHILDMEGNIFYYEDLKFYHLIQDVKDYIDLSNYCSQSVYKLLEYDKKNNTEYFLTLKTYIEEDKNSIETSNKLFIHRNTTNYRLNKIKEITNIDLNNGDELFRITMSIKILEFLNKKEQIGLKGGK